MELGSEAIHPDVGLSPYDQVEFFGPQAKSVAPQPIWKSRLATLVAVEG